MQENPEKFQQSDNWILPTQGKKNEMEGDLSTYDKYIFTLYC